MYRLDEWWFPGRRLLVTLCGTLAIGVAPIAVSAPLHGTVTGEDGQPVSGYMLSIDDGQVEAGDVTVTVFTDAQGRYRTPDLDAGTALQVRGGTPAYAFAEAPDGYLPLSAAKSSDEGLRLDIQVREADTPELLPASAWLSKSADAHGRDMLVLHCTACHQMPTEKIRGFAQHLYGLDEAQRVQAWRAMVQYMRIKVFEIGPEGSLINPDTVPFEVMSDPDNSLFNGYDEQVIAEYMAKEVPTDYRSAEGYRVDHGPSAVTADTLIKEIHLPKTSLVREIALTPKSNYLWGADLQRNRLLRVDPDNPSEQVGYPVPYDKPTGPHTLIDDAEGYIWDGNVEGDVVFRFNPVTEEWQGYQFGPGSVVHDFAIDDQFRVARDADGHVWLTLIGKNKMGKLNTETGEVTEYDVPIEEDNTPFRAAIYGAVMTQTNKVWFSQLTGGVGALDAKTGELVHWVDYPVGEGPRRMTIDRDDRIYVPLFGSGELSILDGNSGEEIKRVALPDPASAPYSAVWDPWRNVVWLGTSNADVIYRYDVATDQISHIPLPSRHGYLRMITFDRHNGNLWTAYSNMPAGSGPSAFIMVDPGDAPLTASRVAGR